MKVLKEILVNDSDSRELHCLYRGSVRGSKGNIAMESTLPFEEIRCEAEKLAFILVLAVEHHKRY